MPTYLLVRHAKARKREDWTEPDHLRPLTERGLQQAEVLAESLSGLTVQEVRTSPAVRCYQTIEPLAERLAHDFCPLEPETAEHPALRRFFLHMSLLWAGTSLVNAVITLWILITQSATTFVIIKSFLGPASTGVMLLLAFPLFRRSMRSAGVSVVFG